MVYLQLKPLSWTSDPSSQPLPEHVCLLFHSHSKLNISQAEFTLYTLKPAILSLPPMLMIGRHHCLTIIQVRSLSNNPKYCCLLLSHPVSNQVTPTQVPSTSPAASSPLPLHLVSIISHVDCTLISFIRPQTGLCVACPSHFFELFFNFTKGKLLAFVDHFVWLYLEFSLEADWFWCLLYLLVISFVRKCISGTLTIISETNNYIRCLVLLWLLFY